MNAILEAALAYADRGWPIFPMSATSRAPLLPCDKDAAGADIRGTGGVKKASQDPQMIRAWWRRWPTAMVAAATGEPMGAFVVDVDVKTEDGRTALAAAEDQHGTLPETWEASTPSGGLHLYFALPSYPMRNRVGFIPGCDVRTTGGSITLPPSVRGGRVYTWRRSPDECELAAAPSWLVSLIAPPEPPRRAYRPSVEITSRYAQAALRAEAAELASMRPNTGRNQKLFVASARLGELVASGALDAEAVQVELEEAARACGLHLDDGGIQGVQATIASGLARGAQRPRAPKSDLSPLMRQRLAKSTARISPKSSPQGPAQ